MPWHDSGKAYTIIGNAQAILGTSRKGTTAMERQITTQLILTHLPVVAGMTVGFAVGPILVLRPQWLFRPLQTAMPNVNIAKGLSRAGLVLILFGMSSLLFACMGQSPWERARTMRRVLQASADEIVSAEVVPWGFPAGDDVFGKPAVVRDHDRLQQLCDCLSKSQSWNLGGVGTTRKCKLTLSRATEKDTCLIENTGNGIVLLIVYDRDAGSLTIGNPIGIFRCDALAPLIDSWTEHSKRDRRL